MANEWEIVVDSSNDDGAPPGVRRLAIHGGYLYQVEHYVQIGNLSGKVVHQEWHAPVFVPFVRQS